MGTEVTRSIVAAVAPSVELAEVAHARHATSSCRPSMATRPMCGPAG
jgi:hypothetical protein